LENTLPTDFVYLEQLQRLRSRRCFYKQDIDQYLGI
jgi:hypothetical protein